MAGGFTISHDEELEGAFDVWVLVRKTLGVQAFGINMVELPQGASIPEHDETPRDQEELFYVVAGSPPPPPPPPARGGGGAGGEGGPAPPPPPPPRDPALPPQQGASRGGDLDDLDDTVLG